jgi:hypothetical protein
LLPGDLPEPDDDARRKRAADDFGDGDAGRGAGFILLGLATSRRHLGGNGSRRVGALHQPGASADDQGNDADDGGVLPVIGDERVFLEIDLEKAQHRKERDHEVTEGKEEGPTPAFAKTPEEREGTDHEQAGKINEQAAGSEIPAWINKHEAAREDRLEEIKYTGHSRAGHLGREVVALDNIGADAAIVLEPYGDEREHEGHGKERKGIE